MKITECIRSRRSVRSFDGNALTSEDAQKIMEFAQTAENPYGVPITWRLLDAEKDALKVPVISGGRTYLAGKLPRQPHAEEAFGYSFETILLFAESLGIGSTCIAGTMDRPAFERAVALEDGEVMPCVSPLGVPAKRMSLRETMMRKAIKADSRMAFGDLFFKGSFDSPLSPEEAFQLLPPLEMVRLAPSAVNKQPWRVIVDDGKVHFYEKRSKGYVSADGWDMQKIDMGIALCHFALCAEEMGIPAAFTVEDPGIPTRDNTIYIASYSVR